MTVLLALLACDSGEKRSPATTDTDTPLPETTPPVWTAETGDTAAPGTPTTPTTPPVPGDGRGADFDGDGADDLVVASPYETPRRLRVFRGGAALDDLVDVELPSVEQTGIFAPMLDAVGDLDGDGYDELAAHTTQANGPPDDFVTVWHGALGLALSGPDVLVDPASTSRTFGRTIGGIGDFDADGVDDMVVTACCYVPSAGTAYVFFGEAGGFTGARTLEIPAPNGRHDFGMAAAGAGDVDGDGVRDLVVGSHYDDDARVYLFLGGATPDADPDADLGGPIGFGQQLAAAGDFDGDGYGDVIASSSGYSRNYGSLWLLLGAVDGLAPEPVLEYQDAASFTDFGLTSAGGADLDGDGFADVAVGNPYLYEVPVFLGGSLDLEPDWRLTGPPGFGRGVGMLDANGDGAPDLVATIDHDFGAVAGAAIFFGGVTFDDAADLEIVAPADDGRFGYATLHGYH